MKPLSPMKTALFLTFLVVIWGVNWPLSKYALTFAPPILFAGIRTLLGGVILLFIALPRYRKLRFKETWHTYLISGVLNVVLFYGLQTVGLKYLPAGLFSAIVFLHPVLLGIFSWLWLGEEMFGLKVIGLLMGFVGVATISADGFTGQISLVGVLLALGCALSWAVGTFYVKKISGSVDPVWLVTLQLIFGGVFMVCLGSEVESWHSIEWNTPFTLSLLFISVFVIAIGWLVFFVLVGSGEATKVASFTFLIPLVAIVSSVLFMHERITSNLLIGVILVAVSIFFVNANRRILVKKRATSKL